MCSYPSCQCANVLDHVDYHGNTHEQLSPVLCYCWERHSLVPHWWPSSAAPGHLPGSPPQLHVLLRSFALCTTSEYSSTISPPSSFSFSPSPRGGIRQEIALAQYMVSGLGMSWLSVLPLASRSVTHWVLRVENSLQVLLISHPSADCCRRYRYFYAVVINLCWIKDQETCQDTLFRCKGN